MNVVPRACPVCGSKDGGTLFKEERLDPKAVTALTYASRKEPEFMSHRLIRCGTCHTVFVPYPPGEAALRKAYEDADFDSGREAEDAAASYARALQPYFARLDQREAAIEVGAGTGAFLPYLQRAGFSRVQGIEPSQAAIDAAPSDVKALITHGVFDAETIASDSCSAFFCFQTMEHVLEPKALMLAANTALKPGGVAALVTHDYSAFLNRVLGAHSPIIDIEHLQLFCPPSLEYLMKECGFEQVEVRSFKNRYRIGYWLRLLPLPSKTKRALIALLDRLGLADLHLSANVGNVLTVGWKAPRA